MIEGDRKLLLRSRGEERELVGAYDLGADPGELRDLSLREEWPARRSRELEPLLEGRTRLLARPESVELGIDEREQLRALGYADE